MKPIADSREWQLKYCDGPNIFGCNQFLLDKLEGQEDVGRKPSVLLEASRSRIEAGAFYTHHPHPKETLKTIRSNALGIKNVFISNPLPRGGGLIGKF